MTEEGFDLFSGATIKVASKKDHEQTRTDYAQLAAAARMGDVPEEQLEGLHPWPYAFDRLYSFRSFDEKWIEFRFDRPAKRSYWTVSWSDEAKDIPLWPPPTTPWYKPKPQKSLLDWPKPFAQMQTVEIKAWTASTVVKQEILPKRAIEVRVWERDRDWRLK